MTLNVKPFFTFVCAVCLVACSPEKEHFVYKKPVAAYGSLFEESVAALPDESYACYLPLAYDAENSYPLMVCFSPDGNGQQPVEQLRFAAETFGYIVAGSNAVKNKNPRNGEAIRRLIYDVQNKYSVDAARMYACGFSGGARLATVLGNQQVVSGVISCGAGPNRYSKTQPYPWYGIVGKSDFNYDEFSRFSADVLQKPFYTVVFHEGGHQWPDSSLLYDAVAFLHLHAYKTNKTERREDIIEAFKTHAFSWVDSLQAQNRYREAYQLANDAATLLSTLTDTEALLAEADSIQQSTAYKADVVQHAELEKLFDEIMKIYPVALVQKDTVWWKSELERLDQRTREASGEAVFTFRRVKSTLGILCYSVSRQLLQSNSPSLKNVLNVYGLLEPDNPDRFYFLSEYERKNGNEEAAAQHLERARTLGFTD